MKNLMLALNAKAQHIRAVNALKEAGIDVSGIKKITDLPKVLKGVYPESMVAQVEAITKNEDAVAALLQAITGVAASGGIMDVIYGAPGDKVKEEDVRA